MSFKIESGKLIGTLSPNTKTIIKNAIVENSKLISLTIPEGVETIESSMLYLMPKLRYIKIPETLKNIAKNSFSVPRSFKYVTYKQWQFSLLIEGGIPRHALIRNTCYCKHSTQTSKLIFFIVFIST